MNNIRTCVLRLAFVDSDAASRIAKGNAGCDLIWWRKDVMHPQRNNEWGVP
ncbi:MAG: hypothetical protein WCE82_01540 [Halobacteriota archaeon]